MPVRKAVLALRAGGVIAYPTEGVWGLGCDPLDPAAVARLLDLKKRPVEKGLILVASQLEDLGEAIADLDNHELDQLRSDPGYPLTWLIPDNGAVPAWITGGAATLAVRISRHPVVARLCREVGSAIVSTSANPSGRPAATSALQVRRYFGKRLDALVPGRLGGERGPSEIRDIATGQVLRPREN